jgi:hypothetical protein
MMELEEDKMRVTLIKAVVKALQRLRSWRFCSSQVSKSARPGATRLKSAIPRAFAALQGREGYFFGSSMISRARRLPMISRQLARSW